MLAKIREEGRQHGSSGVNAVIDQESEKGGFPKDSTGLLFSYFFAPNCFAKILQFFGLKNVRVLRERPVIASSVAPILGFQIVFLGSSGE